MKIKVELKTGVSNDEFNRFPNIDKIKEEIDKYSIGFKGAIVLHKSMYEYMYDLKESYNDVDKKNIIGHIDDIEKENGKLFLIIETPDTFLQDKKYICFFRSKMETTPSANTSKFDEINIFAVDLIMIGESEDIEEQYLSEVYIIPSD